MPTQRKFKTPEDERAFEIVRRLFKDDYGNPFEMVEGQIEIFRAIYERQYPRTQFDCYTQYGKSDTVSMAVLLRATTFAEKWINLGATKEKAGIIVGKLIKHLFENDYTLSKFEVEQDESIESIRRTRSKDKLTFKVDDKGGIGTVWAMSADARRKSADAGDILIGHGAPNLIEDDAALIPDTIHAKALRMLGGHKDNFLLKITNSFGRNHAWRSRNDPKFHKIIIDYTQGIREGRITPEFIEEARASMDPVLFGILYECVYPPADMVEDGGWMPLLTPDVIEAAQNRTVQPFGRKHMALDVAEGTNYNAIVVRHDNYARIKEKTLEKDLMKTAERFVAVATEERVNAESTHIDSVGIGAGVYSRARQLNFLTNGFKGGEQPTKKTEVQMKLDPQEYYNLRAECYWKLRTWIIQGGTLEKNPDWNQLEKIRYRHTSDKKIQIMPKEEMRVRGLIQPSESTDIPDALMMTFGPEDVIFTMPKQTPAIDPYGLLDSQLGSNISNSGLPPTPGIL